MDKSPDAFRTISEVAEELDLPQHVLRFWETRFTQIKPMKRGGGRRYYRPDDVDLLRGIRHLLYGEGYTIRGVQRILREHGGKFVQAVWQAGAAQPARDPGDEEEAAHDVNADERWLRAILPPLSAKHTPSDDAEGDDGGADGGAEPHAEEGDDEEETLHILAKKPAPPVRPAKIGGEDLRKLQAALTELGE